MFKFISKLLNDLGIDDGTKGAEEEAARAAALQRETQAKVLAAQEAQRNMQANFATDLSNQSKATVVAGGTADDVASTTDIAKKKRLGSNFAASLGINI